MADRAFGELVQINAWVGRHEKLEPLLAEAKDRPLMGGATEMLLGEGKETVTTSRRHREGLLRRSNHLALAVNEMGVGIASPPSLTIQVQHRLERDEESVRILASEIAPLESLRERLAREVAIHLTKPADRMTLRTLGEIFSRHRGDRRVSFEVETGEGPNRLRVRVDVGSQIRVRPSPALISEVEEVVGAGAVELR